MCRLIAKSIGGAIKTHFAKDEFTRRSGCFKIYWREGDFIVEYYVECYLLRKELCHEPCR
jgi:hypothetical protein